RERLDFCEKLDRALPELGLAGLTIDRRHIVMPDGPTDLNCLYETVWAEIRKSRPGRTDEVVFHFSSGTASMQVTMLLAAQCLRLNKTRVIETSRQHNVLDMRLPYVLAAREIRERERARVRPRLAGAGREGLSPHTVIIDPVVEAAYAALYKAATERKIPVRVLVRGPEGSGKWHAAVQFARWRDAATVHWLEAAVRPDLPPDSTVLIRHLDTWPAAALAQLTLLAAKRPDLAIVATLRTDRPQMAPPEVQASEGLRGAGQVEIPGLGARSDVPELGESLACQLGLKVGKLKERFQYEWLTDVFPRNLHDLKSLLATADLYGPDVHPDRPAYLQARNRLAAEHRLADTWRALAAMDFGPGRPSLDDLLGAVRAATVLRVHAQGRTQQETGEVLGLSRSTVQAILKDID
ncbi:MAG TPA: hypothetical protein VES73_15000, partial [Lamprocystis sp. (in: g-proteobacteria)]|nr:hypothetical protein [Lamprocystis sp. (in: g-proteobacteria)]